MDTITVYYNGSAIIIFSAVARLFNLRNGQQILTEREFWQILSANASHSISLCEHQINSSEN